MRLHDVATSINVLIDVGRHLEVGRVPRSRFTGRMYVPGGREPVRHFDLSGLRAVSVCGALLASGQSS